MCPQVPALRPWLAKELANTGGQPLASPPGTMVEALLALAP